VTDVLDLFMGAGGTAEGAKLAGLSSLGVEWDATACATARAAGHAVVEGDVSLPGAARLRRDPGTDRHPAVPRVEQRGQAAGPRRHGALRVGGPVDRGGTRHRADHAKRCKDARSILIVEPLRWAMALEPEWIVLEQVPAALAFWQLVGTLLNKRGYSTWAGVLSAERYGVPQTRRRAILMASRTRAVGPPPPSHQAYVSGEPAREEHTLEGVVLPWVSMAEALGWRDGAVGFPRRSTARRRPATGTTASTASATSDRPTCPRSISPRRHARGRGSRLRRVRAIGSSPATSTRPRRR
jgi:DNA (cytosine-5)-methyltransferase 1